MMSMKELFLKATHRQHAEKEATTIPIPTKKELDEFRNDCAEGYNDKVKTFLDKYSATYVDSGKYGWSPLRLAEWRGHAETVQLLKTALSVQETARHPRLYH